VFCKLEKVILERVCGNAAKSFALVVQFKLWCANVFVVLHDRYIIILDPAISGNETEGTYPPFDLGKERNVFITTPSGEIAFGKVWPDLPGIYVNTTWDWDSQTAVGIRRAHAVSYHFKQFLQLTPKRLRLKAE